MNHSAAYMENFEHPHGVFLPPYLTVPMESSYNQGLVFQGLESQQTLIPDNTSPCLPEEIIVIQRESQSNNTFWIAVSGYEIERAYIVYRFFHDIGLIVGKSFTETNTMYLKYLSVLDCEIALSYDGQRIGYGGDIRVIVKLENPVTKSCIIRALEECCEKQAEVPTPIDASIDVEDESEAADVVPQNQVEIESILEDQTEVKYKRDSLLQWFKEKLAYVFYFY
ncbi:uncharacterized protein Dana_GF21499 [Drosophila ananassae]|uniref:Nucleoporin NUP35 n=1 Tax=Drosophila ananassae TaxID=7217 RepID=B3MVP4_DROAN|nr:uncharacterized protein LOC6504180 [Drosophila ananassae]EDV33309.1 uncharacterized protein Dana_GF21499 [Drosophila ananassae]